MQDSLHIAPLNSIPCYGYPSNILCCDGREKKVSNFEAIISVELDSHWNMRSKIKFEFAGASVDRGKAKVNSELMGFYIWKSN